MDGRRSTIEAKPELPRPQQERQRTREDVRIEPFMPIPVDSVAVGIERQVLQGKAVKEPCRNEDGYPEDGKVSTGSHGVTLSSRRTIRDGGPIPLNLQQSGQGDTEKTRCWFINYLEWINPDTPSQA